MITTRFALIPGLLLTLGGCMTNATVELTKAPFDATTQLTNGTIRSHQRVSRSDDRIHVEHHAWRAGRRPLLRAKQKATVFAMHTHENLRADIARGQGEYLASLAALAGVSADRWPDFQTTVTASYPTLFDEQMSVAQSSERVVDIAWANGYGRQLTAHQ
jgi:hypothetical protein